MMNPMIKNRSMNKVNHVLENGLGVLDGTEALKRACKTQSAMKDKNHPT